MCNNGLAYRESLEKKFYKIVETNGAEIKTGSEIKVEQEPTL
jgi:hypothetical protein